MNQDEIFEIVTDMSGQTDFRVSHELNKLSVSTMTPLEIDFFFAFAADIKKEDEKFKKYTISKEVLEKKMGRNRIEKSRANDLLTRISKKQVKIDDENEFTLHNIFSTVSFNKKTEYYSVNFNPILKPLLLQLDTFILGNTKYLFALESKYQKQMYLLMSQWKKRGHFTTKVDTLMTNMEVTGEMRKWGEFRRRVLDASVKSFFDKSDVIFEWKVTGKIGRKIDEITFHIQDNPHFKKSTGLFDADEMLTGFEEYYNKQIQTKQGTCTIDRIEAIGDDLRIYFKESDGFASLPNKEALEKAIKLKGSS